MIQLENPQILQQYHLVWRRRIAILLTLGILTIISFLADLALGNSNLSLREITMTLFGQSDDSYLQTIIFAIRLPTACMAIIVGVALALSGAEMQTILNNPLASPFTLGVSSAAVFGAALTITLGINISWLAQSYLISINAFLLAFGSILLLQYLSRDYNSSIAKVLLFGIALNFTFNALTGLLQYAATAESLQQLIFWGLGSLTRSNWTSIGILLLVIAFTMPFSMHACWSLTALRLGEERAKSLGINVKRLRFFSLMRVSVLAATAVAFVGTIGFIGLVAPNIARLLVGEDHRFFLPASALVGALIMSCASIASKMLITGVILPVGIVTSIIGLPVFFILIYKRSN